MSEEHLWVPHLDELEAAAGLEDSDADLYPKILESICGATDDSQPVEQYDGTLGVTTAFVNANQSMVAQVQWNASLPYSNPGNVAGARWGTGVMISPDLFLTAGHLFDQTGGGWTRPLVNGTSNVISPQEIATNMHLNFNYQVDPSGNLRPEQSFAITQLIEYRLGGIDFAICRIAGSPGNTFGIAQVATADAAVGDMLCIIGHPAGVPKRIEAGPLVDFSGSQVRYNDIDTLGGNSGSGILQASTGRVVGVHTNGGCNAAGTGSNFGMRISSVRAASPTLRSLGATTTAVLADRIGVVTGIAADVLGTNARADAPVLTSPRADRLDTSVVRDVLDTLKNRDDLRTDPMRDLGPVGTLVGRDVIPDPRDPLFDPAIRRTRPFILSTPHHSPVGVPGEAADGSREEYISALTQLEAALEEQQAAMAETAEHYEALRAEYEALYES